VASLDSDAVLPFRDAFRPRRPWWGPDLQTIRNALRGPFARPADGEGRRLELPLEDATGDALVAHLHLPRVEYGRRAPRTLAVLVHGLAGSAESAYVWGSAAELLARGHPVLRLSLRGAGASRPLCRLQYHAGRTEDLRAALRSLARRVPDAIRGGVCLVGYSLGGNLVLKLAGEGAGDLPLRAVVAVSAPIDLAAACERMHAPRNRFYHRRMLESMKQEALAPGAELAAAERAAVETAPTIFAFDHGFVAPRNGWSGAFDYYADAMALRVLHEVRVPALVLHALDDPWIPPDAYLRFPWRENRLLRPVLAAGGGHVGFHGTGDRVPWHDRRIARFFEEVLP